MRQATLEIVKDPGAEPGLLANAEKAVMVTALRPRWKLREILPVTLPAMRSGTRTLRHPARMRSAFSVTMPRLMGILYFAKTRKFFVGLPGARPFFISTGYSTPSFTRTLGTGVFVHFSITMR